MKKFLVCIVAVLLIATCVTLIGCSNSQLMSTNTLNITAELDSWSESAVRAEFAKEKEICLAKDGKSEYVIGYQGDESNAIELAKYLKEITSDYSAFEVKKINEINEQDKSILLKVDKNATDLIDDGYKIYTDNNKNINLVVLDEKYMSNAVYGFLEDVLQVMFPTPDYDYVPNFDTIYLDKLNIVSNPDFAWRKVFQYEVAQNNWFKKLKNNGVVADNIEEHENWGTWCHNVFSFVSPEKYLNTHPEYFVLNKEGEPAQLCLSNPEIYPIIEAEMAKKMQEQPDKKYWDFSINDNWEYCKCVNCKKVLKETGSMMGTMLPIINKLAKAFPDKIISTLAYTYNEKPPKGMKCEKNVNIVLAPIVSGQLYSYKFAGNSKAKKTKELLESWSEISESILIWDYVVDFRHLLMPYPNFDVQKDNHDFYIENNVKAVFHQGSREWNDEMACLRSYVLSKQLWSNEIDINKLIAKYLKVTYGEGADEVAQYMDKCNARLKEKANDLDLYDNPSQHYNDYLSKNANSEYLALINKAISEEKNQEIIDRLELIKINVLYAIMYESNPDLDRKMQAYEEFADLVTKHNIKQTMEVANPEMQGFLQEYPEQAKSYRVKYICTVTGITLGCVLIVALGVLLIIKRDKIKLLFKRTK